MDHFDFVSALIFKYPGAEWVLYEDKGFNEILWHSTDIPKPSLNDIEKAFEEFKILQKSTEYLKLRKSEYPSDEEKSKALWESMVNGNHKPLDEIKQKIASIDAKYPPPS